MATPLSSAGNASPSRTSETDATRCQAVMARPAPCRLFGRDARRRRGRLLFLMQTIGDATGLDHAGVSIDVGLRRVGNELEVHLLRLEHRHVLKERGADLVGDLVGGL